MSFWPQNDRKRNTDNSKGKNRQKEKTDCPFFYSNILDESFSATVKQKSEFYLSSCHSGI